MLAEESLIINDIKGELYNNTASEFKKRGYNVVVLDSFRELVEKARKEDDFFNSHIMVGESIYTIDDLFKEYDELQKRVNEK